MYLCKGVCDWVVRVLQNPKIYPFKKYLKTINIGYRHVHTSPTAVRYTCVPSTFTILQQAATRPQCHGEAARTFKDIFQSRYKNA